MSRLIVFECDACHRIERNLPKEWKAVDTWEDGSVTLHYCADCNAISHLRGRASEEGADEL